MSSPRGTTADPFPGDPQTARDTIERRPVANQLSQARSVLAVTGSADDDESLIRLPRDEIRRLLTAAIAPVHSVKPVINWSAWRRQHQAPTPARPLSRNDHEVSLPS